MAAVRVTSAAGQWRWLRGRPMLIVLLAVGFAASAAVIAAAATPARPKPPTAYQLTLRAKVDTVVGAPRPGRDPSDQQQTSLAAAARQAKGNGTRVADPARDVTGGHRRDVKPSQVITSPKISHQLSSGCATGYGQPGFQCLPTKGPNGVKLTCMYVMNIFPKGVAVLGQDWLHLDSNHDGVACGPSDAM